MKDVILKSIKTFIQAFLACVMGYGLIDPSDKAGYKALLIAGVASGLSALMNVDYKSLEGANKYINKTNEEKANEEKEIEGEG